MTTDALKREIVYDDRIVRAFIVASVAFAVVAMSVGVLLAVQLVFWQANFSTSWMAFGRLRPLHTNAAIFAFVGNMMFAGIYYSTQRLIKARMGSDGLSWVHFWTWQLAIVGAAVSLPLGLTQAKEYAELIWPLDILIAVSWVAFSVNFFWALAKRNEKNLYVSLWFYIATIVTIPVLFIVNNLQLPTSFVHSYPIYAGVQDALVQWWYGHNAVGFFLTTPILGIMYYFIPKACGRPVYSYRLSVVHFWALIFLYIWAGPHHLLFTALPDWAQSTGMLFSLILLAPSWGGMLNGLLTLRGAWDKLKTDPVLKFFVVALTFYGMSTFEGPLLSIKSVNSLAHYTDWIIGHVHGGTLGWNGFMAAGMFYWLVPRLFGTKLWSTQLADAHFWTGTFGILLYVVAMWISGINQGLYWRALDAEGFLLYPDFVEWLVSARFLYLMRMIGGTVYLLGFLAMAFNLIMTARAGKPVVSADRVVVRTGFAGPSTWELIRGWPVVLSLLVVVGTVLFGIASPLTQGAVAGFLASLVVAAILAIGLGKDNWHRLLEGRPLAFTILTVVAILIGGLAELIPSVIIRHEVPLTPQAAEAKATTPDSSAALIASGTTDGAGNAGGTGTPGGAPGSVEKAAAHAVVSAFTQQPYSPLELTGRDIYVREGCFNCHTQMIRPMRHETLRYGEYSRAEEFIYDHPFQWGSRRIGPDLHRTGGKYPSLWHYIHMRDPRATSPGSTMPSYRFLTDAAVDFDAISRKMEALRRLGVPYSESDIRTAAQTARSQALLLATDLAEQEIEIKTESELLAVIAYLQRLGRGPQPTALESAAALEGGN